MTPETREEWIIHQARERPNAERSAFLDGACAGDVALRERLEALLATHEHPDHLLPTQAETVRLREDASARQARPTIKLNLADTPDEAVGQTLGRYKLLEKVGEGGCGVVYVAEQTEPVRRRVALKVIKLGMDTKQVVARFEAERQALAMMDHPNIAKVLDAGTTSTGGGAGSQIGEGRPYFVMELVRGIKITDYCDKSNLPTKERLDLFIKVCQAIQHAHQKGIIHRDIKPSNILVTLHDGLPVPKVIDFGIAKATEGRLTEATVYTQLNQFIGTPAYMSPEQAEMTGLDIDTRSDIYSLGVLLYELLAGSTPFDAKELLASGLDGMRKTIREQEPPRPSTRFAALKGDASTTTAKRRSTDSSRLLHQLKGDLDWIVMKCLEKDRTRRYETANGLAMDIKRHLQHEPVVARPPSSAYRFQKLIRRNKVMSGAAALVLAAVLAGTVISIGQARRATRELRRALSAEAKALSAEEKALMEKANAQAALHFIQDDVLSQATPGSESDRDLKVRTLLDRVSERLDRATGRPPLVQASLRQTLGSIYTELGEYVKAVQHYEGALRLQRVHLAEGHPETLRSLYGLAMARCWSGDLAQAEFLTDVGLTESRAALGERHPLTLQFMQGRAFVLANSGDMPWSELELFMLHALALHREVLGPDDVGTLKLTYGLGLGYILNWQEAKAEPLLSEGLERALRALGTNHAHTAVLALTLSYTCSCLNQLDRGEALALRAWELRRRILGEDNNRTLSAALGLARIYVQQRRFAEAEPITDTVLKKMRGPTASNDLRLPEQVSALAWVHLEAGNLTQAGALSDTALEGLRHKSDAITHALITTRVGAVRLAQKKYSEAETLLREGFLLAERRWPNAAFRFYGASLLGASLVGQGKYSEAEPLLLQGHEGLKQRQASMTPWLNPSRRVMESLEALVQLYDAWGKPAEAAEWNRKLAEFRQAANAAETKGPQP